MFIAWYVDRAGCCVLHCLQDIAAVHCHVCTTLRFRLPCRVWKQQQHPLHTRDRALPYQRRSCFPCMALPCPSPAPLLPMQRTCCKRCRYVFGGVFLWAMDMHMHVLVRHAHKSVVVGGEYTHPYTHPSRNKSLYKHPGYMARARQALAGKQQPVAATCTQCCAKRTFSGAHVSQQMRRRAAGYDACSSSRCPHGTW